MDSEIIGFSMIALLLFVLFVKWALDDFWWTIGVFGALMWIAVGSYLLAGGTV